MSEAKFNIELAEQLRGRDVVEEDREQIYRGPIERFLVKTGKDGITTVEILLDWVNIDFKDSPGNLASWFMGRGGMIKLNQDGHPVAGQIPLIEFESSLPKDLNVEFSLPVYQRIGGTTARILAAGDNLPKPNYRFLYRSN